MRTPPMCCTMSQMYMWGLVNSYISLSKNVFYSGMILEVEIRPCETSGKLSISVGVSFIWDGALWFNWRLLRENRAGQGERTHTGAHHKSLFCQLSLASVFSTAVKQTWQWGFRILTYGFTITSELKLPLNVNMCVPDETTFKEKVCACMWIKIKWPFVVLNFE